MILVDFIGHMVSDKDEKELHKFAEEELGMKRSWYQTPSKGSLITKEFPHYGRHYDLTTSRMIDKALRLGAEQISPGELVRRAWWRKK